MILTLVSSIKSNALPTMFWAHLLRVDGDKELGYVGK